MHTDDTYVRYHHYFVIIVLFMHQNDMMPVFVPMYLTFDSSTLTGGIVLHV